MDEDKKRVGGVGPGGDTKNSDPLWGDQVTQDLFSEEEEEPEEVIIEAKLNLSQQSVTVQENEQKNISTSSAPPDLVHTTQEEEELPKTVTLLHNGNVKVYVVGTAHFSIQSQEDVRQTIRKTRPNLLLLELCNARRSILTLDEETILREAGDMGFDKIKSALSSRSGGVQGLLHLLLLSMSAQLTKKLGMAPGGEFRAAVNEARGVQDCLVVLGDRPFNVTLSRALASLSFKQKVKLAWQFVTSSSDDITKEEIERCKERDLLEKMLSEMTGEFPSITEVFVNERDIYLAHSLFLASSQKDVHTVVGVVGMGHVPGITNWFGKTTEDDAKRVGSPPIKTRSSKLVRVVGVVVKYSVYGLIGYGAFRIVKNKVDFGRVFQRIHNFKLFQKV